MKGSFVDINERSRVEVATPDPSPTGQSPSTIRITAPCELDEPAWNRLVEEVNGMIEKHKRP